MYDVILENGGAEILVSVNTRLCVIVASGNPGCVEGPLLTYQNQTYTAKGSISALTVKVSQNLSSGGDWTDASQWQGVQHLDSLLHLAGDLLRLLLAGE